MTKARQLEALRDNSLSLVFGVLFLAAVVGQALAGHAAYNQQQLSDGGEQLPLAQYVISSSFAVDVAENWQSEYLQFFLYIVATVWLVQRGSPEFQGAWLGGHGIRPGAEGRALREANVTALGGSRRLVGACVLPVTRIGHGCLVPGQLGGPVGSGLGGIQRRTTHQPARSGELGGLYRSP